MSEVTSYTPGTFCWIELATTDPGAATRFYTELFGLGSTVRPMGPDGHYTLLQKNGRDVAGIYRQLEEHAKQGVPPNWVSYVTVESADASRARAIALGAQGGPEPFDVADIGRMAMLVDPTGAFIALWEPRKSPGAAVVNEHGALMWNELQTVDVEKARAFYTQLFGWTAKTSADYVEFHKPDRAAGGMREWKDGHANWLPYFGADDTSAIVRHAEELGGTTLLSTTDIPNVGKIAVLRDPQGATFAVITPMM
ncbi:MAG: VOC family protein [Acidobacteria bacterium]|nr:VOC family protein [Acidobacteriota bacterium]